MARTPCTQSTMRGALLVLLAAPALFGFSSAASFDLEADVGGGGGYTFTGSPVNHGMSCLECHQRDGAAVRTGVFLHSDPAGLFSEGYVPGQIYTVTVHLTGEDRGLARNGSCPVGAAGCNRNLFVAELLDAGGVATGTLCPDGIVYEAGGACADQSGARTTLLRDGRAVSGQSLAIPLDCGAPGAVAGLCVDIAGMQASGATQDQIAAAIGAQVRGSTVWAFQWRAPDQSVGTVDLWLGAVDGDGGTRVDPRYADYAGDVAVVERYAIPAFADAASPGGGCVGGGAGAALWILTVMAAWVWGTRRRGEV